MRNGARVTVGGIVLTRQQPGTAKGVVFATLEDETGSANAVVWRDVFEANRRTVMASRFLVVHGRLQRVGDVIHVVAQRFTDLSARLADLREAEDANVSARLQRSRDFH
jgi:error-prone DNA polymerase